MEILIVVVKILLTVFMLFAGLICFTCCKAAGQYDHRMAEGKIHLDGKPIRNSETIPKQK